MDVRQEEGARRWVSVSCNPFDFGCLHILRAEEMIWIPFFSHSHELDLRNNGGTVGIMWEVAHAAVTNAVILHRLTGGSGSGLHFLWRRMQPDSIGRSVDILLRCGAGLLTWFVFLVMKSWDSGTACVCRGVIRPACTCSISMNINDEILKIRPTII